MTPSVVVTRPVQEATDWVRRLGARGVHAVALPLIAIEPAADRAALADMAARIAEFDAVMFVSANAVEHFLAAAGPWPDGPRAWATGPGTRDALLRHGVTVPFIDAPSADASQFDSETLWQGVGAQMTPGRRVLIVRGGDAEGRASGRDWLAQRILAAGAQVETVVAYRRMPPAWSPAEIGEARAAAAATWLFSSSEAVGNLSALLPGQDWSAARAIATHARIAEAARAAGFARVDTCRPAFDDVVASIESTR